MRIFNLPQKHGFQAPLALLGAVGGGVAATGTALGAIGGAAIGGGLGMMAGGALSKPSKISAPKARNYLGEMQDALRSQEAIQGQLLGLENKYTPLYQQLQEQALTGQISSLSNLYRQAGEASSGLQNQYVNMQMPIYSRIGQEANLAYQQGLGADTIGLYNTMQRQAQAGLDAGYGLTPDMERQAQQSARAAMTARGLVGGNQGVAQEVLNSYALGQQRYQTALSNAQQAYGLGVNMLGNAMGTYGTPLIQSAQSVAPNVLLGGAMSSYGSLGAKLFQPESQYNAGVYGANQSNEMQTRLANAQIDSAYSTGLMSAGAMIASAGVKKP